MTASPAHLPPTPLLDTVNAPADIRRLQKAQLPQLSDELRQEMISAVSVTGGHLGAGLGVVEQGGRRKMGRAGGHDRDLHS